MKHLSRYTLLLALGLVLMIALAACQGAAVPAEEEAAEEEAAPAEEEAAEEEAAPAEEEPMEEMEPIVIGASLPLTGDFAINGQKHQEGYELCVDLINQGGGLIGRPVELIVSDNQSDVETSLNQFERFINVDNVDFIFGTFSSRLTFPTTTITEQNQMVHPIPSGAALRIYSRGYEYLFYFQEAPAELVGSSPVEMIQQLAAAEDAPTSAAVVFADDFFAGSIANGLLGGEIEIEEGVTQEVPSVLEDAGIEVVYQEMWPETGFSDWVTLANSIKNSGAEAVFGLTASPEETINLTNALQTVDYQPKFVYMSQGTQAEFLEGVGDAAEGVVIHAAWHELANWEGELNGEPFTNQDFQDAYLEKYGQPADEDVAIPFALCQGIEQAVRGTESTDNTVVRDWLASRTAEEPVKTILGDFYWDERGLPIGRTFLMTQWQGGELKFVYPTDEFPGVAEFIYPKPEW